MWRIDRLGRSLPDLVTLIADLEARGVQFRSLTESIDTTTPGGELVFHLFAALAQMERRLISERTRAGLTAARARGRHGGRPTVMTPHKLAAAQSLRATTVSKGLVADSHHEMVMFDDWWYLVRRATVGAMTHTPVKQIATVLAAGSLLLGAVAAAPAASAATPTTSVTATLDASGPSAGLRTSLVAAWYEQFLGRSSAGDAGAQYWVARLRTQAPETVLADLLGTPEFVGAQIDGYYTDYLGRGIEGDPAADYWFSGVYQDRFPLEWVEQNVLASDEYAASTSAADPGRRAQLVVAQWYRDVLGREADTGEVGYWSIQFEDQDPLFLLRQIWYSPEAVGVRVASHYEDHLRRPASSGEVAYWAPAEVASDVDVVIAIASSQEYQKNALTKGTAG